MLAGELRTRVVIEILKIALPLIVGKVFPTHFIIVRLAQEVL
jgi:hypothetical protein